ncbi:MAG TPA: hypothetical protein VFY43_05610, partial [Candidatus Limnocylindria bacterium]|nr:hypothetical protein [Candidatus Limnocylindria bacterium]
MTFWDGNRWVPEAPAVTTTPSRLSAWLATGVMVLGLAAMIVPITFVAAARHNSYRGTLVANPSSLRAGDSFTVGGCGYDTRLGNVIVGFTGGSWGSPLDADGCFSISEIP